MADDTSWAARVARLVATNVRYWRTRRKMSAETLSAAMTAAGAPMNRSVLANFENGRRPSLSVAELLAFAAVLRVPPLALLIPDPAALREKGLEESGLSDESASTMEILQGRTVPVPEALAWLADPSAVTTWDPIWTPAENSPAAKVMDEEGDGGRLHRLLQHQTLLGLWSQVDDVVKGGIWAELRIVRAQMQASGELLPDLPAPLAEQERAPGHWLTSNTQNAQQRRALHGLPPIVEEKGDGV
jgi:transcriptional regulator with XRE-family HTH domain